MDGRFAEDHEEDEQWLQEHRNLFEENQKKKKKRPKKRKRTRNKKRKSKKKAPPTPINVGKKKKKCRHCGQLAPAGVFLNTKCLACQVAEVLHTL